MIYKYNKKYIIIYYADNSKYPENIADLSKEVEGLGMLFWRTYTLSCTASQSLILRIPADKITLSGVEKLKNI